MENFIGTLSLDSQTLTVVHHHLVHSPPLSSGSVLKRWKLNWCDLWIDGSLVFYKSESRREYEHRVNLKTSCVEVMIGLECGGGFCVVCVRERLYTSVYLCLPLVRESVSVCVCACAHFCMCVCVCLYSSPLC